jgi:hypothetical protein
MDWLKMALATSAFLLCVAVWLAIAHGIVTHFVPN